MKELVLFLAKQLVNHPDAVEVKETQGDTASVLELKVAREDIGRVIGKQGRTAKSIRTILECRRVPHEPEGRPRNHRRRSDGAGTTLPAADRRSDRRRRRRARRPHGLRGELRLWPYQPDAPSLTPGRAVLLERDGAWRATTIVAVPRPTASGMLVALDGVADRDAAAALTGHARARAAADLPALDAGASSTTTSCTASSIVDDRRPDARHDRRDVLDRH